MKLGVHWMMKPPGAADAENDHVGLAGTLTLSCELDSKLTASRLWVGRSDRRSLMASVTDSYDFSGEPSLHTGGCHVTWYDGTAQWRQSLAVWKGRAL